MDGWNTFSFPGDAVDFFQLATAGSGFQSGRMVDIKAMMPKNLRPNPKQWRPDGRLGWGQKI